MNMIIKIFCVTLIKRHLSLFVLASGVNIFLIRLFKITKCKIKMIYRVSRKKNDPYFATSRANAGLLCYWSSRKWPANMSDYHSHFALITLRSPAAVCRRGRGCSSLGKTHIFLEHLVCKQLNMYIIKLGKLKMQQTMRDDLDS